jgi:phosphate transport system permease protein
LGDVVSRGHEHPSRLDTIDDPLAGIDFGQLERSLRRPRTLFDFLLSSLIGGMTLLSLIPLFSVLLMLLWRGGRKLSLAVFTELPPAALEAGGGFGNAIVGTLIIVAMAVLMSVPVGLLTAIYLAQNPDRRLSGIVRFSAKVLTGFPSILAGVFAYGAIVLTTGGYSAVAGAIALSILMLPTIILTSEDAIRMVPSRMKDAAIGMGATKTQTVWMVLLPTAIPGILTGVMLAVARAAGETAPLLFTATIVNDTTFNLDDRMNSLPALIFQDVGQAQDRLVTIAWGAALTLVAMILILTILARLVQRRSRLS